METSEIKDKLIANGWIEENITNLPHNQLNAGLEAYLTYKGKHTFRYHPKDKFIRLMILGEGDERCLQLDYENKLSEVLEHLISVKEDLTMDNYISQYLALQEICPTSILAVEQFL